MCKYQEDARTLAYHGIAAFPLAHGPGVDGGDRQGDVSGKAQFRVRLAYLKDVGQQRIVPVRCLDEDFCLPGCSGMLLYGPESLSSFIRLGREISHECE